MIVTFMRLLTLMAVSIITGILGAIWLFGAHASIWVTVGVKPFSVLLLIISLVTYDQLRRELSKIDKRENRQNKINH